jgi:hypothetical protein
MHKCLFASLLFATAAPAATAPDGLFYQLPADGSSVRFEMTIKNDKENPRTESVVMRSVGTAGDARWLEFKLPSEDTSQTLKVLIPERVLKEGESPMEHIVRGWRKIGDDMPVALTRVRDFWLLVFLAGPLSDVAKLESVEVDSPIGKLKCDRLTGKAHLREDDGYEEELKYEVTRHPGAPFGVIACRIDCLVSRDGKRHDQLTFELKLIEVGKGAASELREYQ